MRLIPKALAPKLLALTLAVTLAVVCVISIALFANSRIIVDRFLNDSVESRRENLVRQFESQAVQATASLEREIDSLARDRRYADLQRSLDESATELESAHSIQVFDDAGRLIGAAGPLNHQTPIDAASDTVEWRDTALLVTRDILLAGKRHGELRMAFSLTAFQNDLNAFRERQLNARRGWQSNATTWVLITSLVVALLCGCLSWLAARRLVRPIEAITRQARRMQQGDYGEPLRLARSDELGELATAFDSMRDQLRQTTISRDYMDNLLSSMNDAVIVTDDHGAITHCNAAAVSLTGYTETQLLGMPIADLVIDEDRDKLTSSATTNQPQEARFVTNDGRQMPVSWTASDVETGNALMSGRIYSAQNITERKRSEERIRYLARMDPMTKVPNRMQFQHLLQRASARARRSKHTIGLFYLDVDQFKDINDTFGHLAGDTTLEILTQCMSRALPEGAVIGRLAGDEFAAFIDNLPNDATARTTLKETADRLLLEIAEPFDVQSNEVYMTASVGIAVYPNDADNVIDLLRNADAALYAAKKAGGNRMMFYDTRMNDDAVERLMLKSRLRRSFERDELLLQYQPKYELATGQIVGAEALIRWEMPGKGRIQPNDFIPLAEQTGLIIQIGEWVIERVCEDVASWHRDVGDPGRIAINLSLKQLRKRNFFDSVNKIFSRHAIKPSDIEFEITETTLMEDIPRTIEVLEKLQAYGLQLAIDDFGTGYSSLSALQKFPIKTLKIDQSFVRNAANDDNDAAIISAIVDMSRRLRLEVVAEGVETEAQLAFLRDLRCDFGQGMLFGEPMDAQEFGKRLLAQLDGTDQHKALFA